LPEDLAENISTVIGGVWTSEVVIAHDPASVAELAANCLHSNEWPETKWYWEVGVYPHDEVSTSLRARVWNEDGDEFIETGRNMGEALLLAINEVVRSGGLKKKRNCTEPAE